MFASLRDCVPLIKWCRHHDTPQVLLLQFEEEVDGYLKEKILDPLCQAVEKDLRLSTHLHLQLEDRNPFKVCVCVFHLLINVNECVTLVCSIYNLLGGSG